MRYRLLQSQRRLAVHSMVTLLALTAAVCLCLALGGKRYLALTSSLCMAGVVSGTFVLRSRFKALLRTGGVIGRDLALARTMAAASRQPFFFCCPQYSKAGELEGISIRFVNRAACAALGIAGKHLRDSLFSNYIDPASHSALLREVSEVLSGHRAEDIPLVFVAREGQHERYEVRLMPLADGIAMTTLQSREEELAHQRADAADQFTKSVFENAPVSIIATDATGTIVAANSAAEKLTLYRSYDLIGVHSILVLHDAVELSARSVDLSHSLQRNVSAGFESLALSAASSSTEREWTYIRRDGSRIWVCLTVSPLKDPAGEISGYLAVAFDVTERRRLTEATQYMAHHDQLTRLPNRLHLAEHIESSVKHAIETHCGIAVFLVDIDHFKRINDSLGHAGGDSVLVTVANRLLQAVRASDKVVRVGGDEFVLILPEMDSEEHAARRAQLLLDALSMPFLVGTREVRITASIGYCLVSESEESAASLLRRADLAMYAAKAAGRNSARAYGAELQQETADRLEMEEDLRHAIERGELALHYQPQVTCGRRHVASVEMLLRWNSAKRGNVPPDVFIPVAEQAGLMSEIGRWALRQACFDCVDAQASLGQRLRVAVNLSAREFLNAGLPAVVSDALAESHLAPEDLELEITEQVLMSTSPQLLKTLENLRESGVSLAIDDFGIGFSNFSYILQYQVDRLKIDRSFISRVPGDPGAAAIVRTVLAMAHGLGIKVCAEGVETSEQMDFLVRRHCDDIQGWYYSKAVPLAELPDVIRNIQTEPSRVRRVTNHNLNVTQPALTSTTIM